MRGGGDLLADLHVRRQGGQRVLEDHRHLRAAQPVDRLLQLFDLGGASFAFDVEFGKLVGGGKVTVDVRDGQLAVDAQAEPEKLLPATV